MTAAVLTRRAARRRASAMGTIRERQTLRLLRRRLRDDGDDDEDNDNGDNEDDNDDDANAEKSSHRPPNVKGCQVMCR